MYFCQITGRHSKLGEGLNKIVISTRSKIYTRWIRNDELAASIAADAIINRSADGKWLEVFVASGTEIVKEVNASREGVATWESWTEGERYSFKKHYYPHLVKQEEMAEKNVGVTENE